jgi:molecular chaperone DnaJ
LASAEVRPCSFDAEVECSADVAVPTLDGGSVKVRLPAGTRSGHTFRVRGKGVAARRKTGDMLVTVEVAVPRPRADLAKLRKQATEAVADVHRQHKRELVPLRQAVAVFHTPRR